MIDYLPYIIVFLLLLAAVVLETLPFPKNQKEWVKGFVLLILALFVGLRYNTGADWAMYIYCFENMPTQGNIMDWEPGFYLLSNLFYYVFHNYYVLQFLATVFLLFAINRLYSRYDESPIFLLSIAFLLFFRNIFMCQVRQSIALSIILLGTPYILNRKFLPFLLTVLIAMQFHISAVVAFFLYFMTSHWNKVLCCVLLLISQIFILYPHYIADIFVAIAPFLPPSLEVLVEDYMGSIFAQPSMTGVGVYYILTMVVGFFVLIVLKPSDRYTSFVYNTFLVSLVLVAITQAVPILSRLQSYFYLYGIISFGQLALVHFKGFKISTTQILVVVFLILLNTIPNYGLLISNEVYSLTNRPQNYSYVPYYNVLWHPAEAEDRLDWFEK